MPATATADEFLDVVRRSALVDESRITHWLELLAAGGVPDSPKLLAKRAVSDGLLTPFQAEQCLAGKWRGFSLGKYRILDRIGSGGMGTVYLAEHSTMKRRVAVKVLPPKAGADPESRERFYREARAAGALSHPNIVRAYDIDQDGNLHFMVMEYVDGASLHQLVTAAGPLDGVRAGHYLYQAALGLQHAHEAGLVHRDIKPANLLVDRQGTVKLLDLGLARFYAENDGLTQNHDGGSVLGTADYLAPEQAMDSHAADARSDIYSLGATAYFLLTGRAPFADGTVAQKLIQHQFREPPPVAQFNPHAPADLVDLIGRMMAKDPANRPAEPYEVAVALEAYGRAAVPAPAAAEMPEICPALAAASTTGVSASRLAAARSGVRGEPAASSMMLVAPPGDGSLSTGTHAAATAKAPPPRRSWAVRWAGIAAALLAATGAAVAVVWYDPVGWWPADAAVQRTVAANAPPKAEGRPADAKKAEPKPKAAEPKKAESKPKDAPKATAPPIPVGRELLVAAGGEFPTLQAALDAAKPGDRVVLRDPVAAAVRVAGTGLPRGLTIEGRPADGKGRVAWTAPADHPDDKPLLEVIGAEDFAVTNVTFDGGGKVREPVRVGGACPGLTLAGVTVTRFVRVGVRLSNVVAPADRPAKLTGLRLTGAVGTNVAGGVVVTTDARVEASRNVQVTDGRFDGMGRAAVAVDGPVAGLVVSGCRLSSAAYGVYFVKPDVLTQATVDRNTFARMKAAIQLAGRPRREGSGLTVTRNVFTQVGFPVGLDGLDTAPVAPKARWVWTDEAADPLASAPLGPRWFRKTFDGPTGPARATLDIVADDLYTVWLNGQEVGRGRFQGSELRVFGHDVGPLLRPGPNILAVRAENVVGPNGPTATNGAGLLARLTIRPASGPASEVNTDATWKFAAAAPPAGWEGIAFDDAGWAAARVCNSPTREPGGPLLWESVILPKLGDLPTWLVEKAEGNVRASNTGRYAHLLPTCAAETFTLATDAADDGKFLRYPGDHVLARKYGSPGAGPGRAAPKAADKQ